MKKTDGKKKKPKLKLVDKGDGNITLSACMMVKNESLNLDRCLSSIRGIVDEIIVVDTGSTDDSVEICKKYGAKVYHHPWEDNFSLHRNQSMSYANGDWLLIVDADEEVVAGKNAAQALRKSLAAIPDSMDAASVLFEDIQKEMVLLKQFSARLLRKGRVVYESIIHNQPKIRNNTAVQISDISIRHYGYDLSPEKAKAKAANTRRMLLKSLKECPEFKTAYFYLAQNYAQMKEFEQAVIYGEQYLQEKDSEIAKGTFMVDIYYCIYHCYKDLGNVKKAAEWLNAGIAAIPQDLDMTLGLVEFGIWQRRSDIVMLGAKKFMELYEKYTRKEIQKDAKFIYSHVPEALAFCHFHLILVLIGELEKVFVETRKNLPQVTRDYAKGLAADYTKLLEGFGAPSLIERIVGKKHEEAPADLFHFPEMVVNSKIDAGDKSYASAIQ